MSRAPVFCSGRSGNPKVEDLSLEPAGLKPGRVKPKTLKLILIASWPGAQHYLDREKTGWLSVRII